MSAFGNNLAVIHDHYNIGVHYSAEAMRYDEAGPVLQYLFDCFMYLGLAVGIYLAGGFIKYQYRRVFQDRSCNDNPLQLTAAEPYVLFAYDSIVTVGKGFDEFMGKCSFGSIDYLVHRGLVVAVGDIG